MCCAWRVKRSADSLPDDGDALRALALNAVAERDAAIAERDRLIELNDRLRRLLRKAQGFEAKSERLAKLHPEQLNLALEDLEQAIAKTEATEEKTQTADAARKRRINRGVLPAHLPRTHETVAPADTNCPCCKKPMHVIGEETSERLDVIPAQYRVIITHRPRLACRACEKIVEAPAPEHLIKSGLPTEAMVASVLVAKYGWHLPLYRQAKMLASQGIDLDRSTLAFWVGYAAAELMPLYERLKANLLASAKLAVDETPVPVLDPGRGQTKTGYFWAIARDDRPWGGTGPPAVVYSYAPGRGGEHLEEAARKLSRHRAVRRLCSLQEIAGGQDHSRLLLEPLAARILQDRRARRCAHRHRSRRAHCPDLRHREGCARHKCRSAPCRAPDKIAPTHQRAQDLLRASAHAALGRIGYRQDHPLRPQALGRPHPLP